MEDVQRNTHHIISRISEVLLPIKNLIGIKVLKVKGTILKKINVSFIVPFCLGEIELKS